MTTFFGKLLLFCILLLAAQTVISLDWSVERNLETGKAEALRIGIPKPYEPSQEILAIQQHQREHPELGFLWKPSIDTTDEVVVAWGDIPAGELTTGRFGFANSPSAIDMLRAGTPVDIVGVGASYMGGAQGLFHEYMALNGYYYYNMAHGRFTLPQYNIALERYAVELDPTWVVYGLNEVSFTLIPDFEGWRGSGLEWFDYHNGTWCGPTRKTGFPHDQLRPHPRLYRVYQSVIKSLLGGSAIGAKPSPEEMVDKTFGYVHEAWQTARKHDIGFVLLLIPSRNRMIHGPSAATYLFEEIVPRLKQAGIPYIDLRKNYATVEDPSTLYFQFDAHWNRTGVYRAVREVLGYIEKQKRRTTVAEVPDK